VKHEPEITIARGHRHTCVCCVEVHDVNVAIDRAMWICAPCTKALFRVGAVILKAEEPSSSGAGLQLEACNAPESDVAGGDASVDR
jgi:hypothetical protein